MSLADIERVGEALIRQTLTDCGGNKSAVIRQLNLSNSRPVRKALKDIECGLLADKPRSKVRDEDIIAAVKTSACWSDVVRELGLKAQGGNISSIKSRATRLRLCIDHFDVKSTFHRNRLVRTAKDVFIEHSSTPRPSLRSYVDKFGVLGEEICSECKCATTYNHKPIRLQVDHINGISDDNRVENLRWLCPNCHSQTDTFGSRNRA